MKLKSMTPFVGCTNRQASETGCEVVGATAVVVGVVVPRRKFDQTNRYVDTCHT